MVGLMGSGHCFAMCGGLASALGYSSGGSRLQQMGLLFIAQLGRLTSYAVIGALFGGSIALVQGLFEVKSLLMVLQALANFMLIAMGLYIAGWWFGLKRVEAITLPLWRKLQPIQQKFMPLKTSSDAFMVGVFWGWLPCGLVYSALVTSVSGSADYSAAIGMFAFGLGTLPSVWLVSTAGAGLKRLLNNHTARILMGIVLISYGIKQLIQIIKMIF